MHKPFMQVPHIVESYTNYCLYTHTHTHRLSHCWSSYPSLILRVKIIKCSCVPSYLSKDLTTQAWVSSRIVAS